MKISHPNYFTHPNCRCVMIAVEDGPVERERKRKEDELGRKLQARLFLTASRWNRSLVVPIQDEWIGLNLLERDDELSKDKDGKWK